MRPDRDDFISAAKRLAAFDRESTRHMAADEREAGIHQMLLDLYQLANSDGCIAAAWAFEFVMDDRLANEPAKEI